MRRPQDVFADATFVMRQIERVLLQERDSALARMRNAGGDPIQHVHDAWTLRMISRSLHASDAGDERDDDGDSSDEGDGVRVSPDPVAPDRQSAI